MDPDTQSLHDQPRVAQQISVRVRTLTPLHSFSRESTLGSVLGGLEALSKESGRIGQIWSRMKRLRCCRAKV